MVDYFSCAMVIPCSKHPMVIFFAVFGEDRANRKLTISIVNFLNGHTHSYTSESLPGLHRFSNSQVWQIFRQSSLVALESSASGSSQIPEGSFEWRLLCDEHEHEHVSKQFLDGPGQLEASVSLLSKSIMSCQRQSFGAMIFNQNQG